LNDFTKILLHSFAQQITIKAICKKKREFYLFKLEQVRYKTILDIPNFTFDRQITCIVGPSGSGKTTLLRLLNKMYLPTAGNIFYNKTSLTEIDTVKLRRKVVMLGQTPILYPGTIEDNLQIGRRFSEDEDAPRNLLQGALEKVGLPKSLSDSCNKLSGGEKQRLCMARILLMDAETYLMDEPSAALDPEMEYQMTKNLAEFVREKGRQLILITHSNQVSSMFPEDIVTLESGKIKEGESL
jgi:putative ABC transport system ATP-binding protein